MCEYAGAVGNGDEEGEGGPCCVGGQGEGEEGGRGVGVEGFAVKDGAVLSEGCWGSWYRHLESLSPFNRGNVFLLVQFQLFNSVSLQELTPYPLKIRVCRAREEIQPDQRAQYSKSELGRRRYRCPLIKSQIPSVEVQ